MKQIVTITAFLVAFATAPLSAQDQPDEADEGFSLMEEGAQMLLRGLMTEIAPAIEDLERSLQDMGPALQEFVETVGPVFADLLDQIDDLRFYEAPQIMPNGDIIIRRSPDAPTWDPDDVPGAIDL